MDYKAHNPAFVKVEIYKVDWYNLHLLTQKLTQHSKPSRSATLHALLRLACRQHGIDPLENVDEIKGREDVSGLKAPNPKITRRQRERSMVLERRISDVDGVTIIDLGPRL